MKLLVLGTYGDHAGGVATVVREVTRRLSGLIDEILVIAARKRKQQYLTDFTDGNLSVVYQPCGNIPGVAGSDLVIREYRMKRKLNSQKFDPDVVWINHPADFAAFSKSKFADIPSTYTLHGSWDQHYLELAKTTIKKPYFLKRAQFFHESKERFAEDQATQLTTYSEYLRNRMNNLSGRDDIHVIPNGVDSAIFRHIQRKREDVIVYVGRFSVVKGTHIILSSFKQVLSEFPEWELWLAGGTNKDGKNYLPESITEFELRKIKFLGRVPHVELPLLLNRAKIFALPTVGDGFEIALMEALATGIPCITTSSPERSKIYKKVAEIVSEATPSSLAKGIVHMINNYDSINIENEREKRIRYANQYDWDKIHVRYCDVFKDAIRAH